MWTAATQISMNSAIVGANASAESLKGAGGDGCFYLMNRLYLKGYFCRLLCFLRRVIRT